MYSIDDVRQSIAELSDDELVQRWKDRSFDITYQPFAAKELQRRGIDPNNPVVVRMQKEDEADLRPYRPVALPALFSLFAAMAGQQIGGALAGGIGAGTGAAILVVVGWYAGRFVAQGARRRKTVAVKVATLLVGSAAWIGVCAVGVSFGQLYLRRSTDQSAQPPSLPSVDLGVAGNWEPRPEAIKNFGSGYAAAVLCATRGFAQPDAVARLGTAYQTRMTAEAYKQFRDQYQRSLHEKKIYSIAADRWVPFEIDEAGCATVDRSTALLIARLQPSPADASQLTPSGSANLAK